MPIVIPPVTYRHKWDHAKICGSVLFTHSGTSEKDLQMAEENPQFDIHVFGPFPGKTLNEVSDFVVESLHDWLNPDWKEGDDCKCEFVATANVITEDEDVTSEEDGGRAAD